MRSDQWKTILWLRWRLSRNQWARFGRLNAIASVVIAILLIVGAILAAVQGFVLGYFALAKASPRTLLFAWDALATGFLFFWLIGLLVELQRRESLDLSKLLHLPISLKNVFFFNYVVSWVTPSLVIFLPAAFCLALGLALKRGPYFLLLIPAILGFFSIVTAWTYLVRGWLAVLMANERHRRTVVVLFSILLVALVQLPNLYFQTTRMSSGKHGASLPHLPAWFESAHYVAPPLWVGKCAHDLAAGQLLFPIAVIAASFALGGLALNLSYRSTVRAYQGAPRFSFRQPKAEKPVKRSRMLEWRLPFLPDDVATVALAALRSHLRAPELKMILASQLVTNLVFGFMFLRPHAATSLPSNGLFSGAVITTLSMMGASQLFFNQFGFDRDGFRTFVLSPISREHLLLGKTLATFPVVMLTGCLVLIAGLVFHLVPGGLFLVALLNLGTGFFIFSTLGNWLSIISPYRIAQGSLKPAKAPPQVSLMILFGALLTPVVGAVIFLPSLLGLAASWYHWSYPALIQIAAALVLLGSSVVLFFGTSRPLGRLLASREKKILHAVTQTLE